MRLAEAPRVALEGGVALGPHEDMAAAPGRISPEARISDFYIDI